MKRYDICIGREHGIDGGVPCLEVDEYPDGEWVRYEDAEKMRAEIERQGEVISDLSAEVVRRGPPGNGRWVEAEAHEQKLKALRETLAARQTAAEYSRRQCEKAEASLRFAEQLLLLALPWLSIDVPEGIDATALVEVRKAIRKELKLT